MSIEYVGKMTQLMNYSLLYLYEKHIPLELRMNFVCNTLYWYWLKPDDVPDYCYTKIITLVNECLLEGQFLIISYDKFMHYIIMLKKYFKS